MPQLRLPTPVFELAPAVLYVFFVPARAACQIELPALLPVELPMVVHLRPAVLVRLEPLQTQCLQPGQTVASMKLHTDNANRFGIEAALVPYT